MISEMNLQLSREKYMIDTDRELLFEKLNRNESQIEKSVLSFASSVISLQSDEHTNVEYISQQIADQFSQLNHLKNELFIQKQLNEKNKLQNYLL